MRPNINNKLKVQYTANDEENNENKENLNVISVVEDVEQIIKNRSQMAYSTFFSTHKYNKYEECTQSLFNEFANCI